MCPPLPMPAGAHGCSFLAVVNGLRLTATGHTLPAVTAHIVTCHLTLVNAPSLNPIQTSLYLIYVPLMD